MLPHTVQHYGLRDPAPTYGNPYFNYIREFLRREVGSRPVVYYPESAYWVSFDVDVPLFLPLYAERRVSDLRLLAGDEKGRPRDGRPDGVLERLGTDAARLFGQVFSTEQRRGCLAEPSAEPKFPQDDLRSRP